MKNLECMGAYGRVFAVDYNGIVCAAKEVHSILVCGVSEKELRLQGKTFSESASSVQNYVIQISFSFWEFTIKPILLYQYWLWRRWAKVYDHT